MPKPINDTGLDSTALAFLDAQKPSTRSTYKSYMRLWLEFTNKTAQQIIEEKKADKDAKYEHMIFEFKKWLIETK